MRPTTKQSQMPAIQVKKLAVLIARDRISHAISTCECDSNAEVFQTVWLAAMFLQSNRM